MCSICGIVSVPGDRSGNVRVSGRRTGPPPTTPRMTVDRVTPPAASVPRELPMAVAAAAARPPFNTCRRLIGRMHHLQGNGERLPFAQRAPGGTWERGHETKAAE